MTIVAVRVVNDTHPVKVTTWRMSQDGTRLRVDDMLIIPVGEERKLDLDADQNIVVEEI